jgi:AraC-like DNA-binding protein
MDRLQGLAGWPRCWRCSTCSRGRATSGRSRAGSSRPRSGGRRGRIDRVCRILNERCTERITLAEAARPRHLSIPAFSRFFRRKTGRTLVAYLNELRTGLACRS